MSAHEDPFPQADLANAKRALLEGASVNAEDTHGRSALHICCARPAGDGRRVVELLIQQSCILDRRTVYVEGLKVTTSAAGSADSTHP